ncbi:hypothetical protein QQ045_008719 [Rhodiola kirilowii]
MCCCGDDCKCRPIGFLVGLPFALLSILLSLIGIIIWIVGNQDTVMSLLYLCHCDRGVGNWTHQSSRSCHGVVH